LYDGVNLLGRFVHPNGDDEAADKLESSVELFDREAPSTIGGTAGCSGALIGLLFGRKHFMVRKLALVVVLALVMAPAFLLAGCQTSSSDRPYAMTGSQSQASYPKYMGYNAR
jgi:hypothetical protein